MSPEDPAISKAASATVFTTLLFSQLQDTVNEQKGKKHQILP
jgi:hypothetical protein